MPVALNSGVHWTGFLKRPGTIVLEFLDPIAAGHEASGLHGAPGRAHRDGDQPAAGAVTALDRRACGPCTACCVELKIDAPELRKKARAPCPHLTASGCGIYEGAARLSAGNSSAAGGCLRNWMTTGGPT